MKKIIYTLALLAASSSHAAVIEDVTLRQSWPWSTDIVVSFTLSGVETPVYIDVEPFDGSTQLKTAEAFRPYLTGDVYALTNGTWSFRFDPRTALGLSRKALEHFSVKLTTITDDIVYKIFDLTDGSCEDVWRGGLLSGRYGAVETS